MTSHEILNQLIEAEASEYQDLLKDYLIDGLHELSTHIIITNEEKDQVPNASL